ncbi:Hypothetical protein, putative [Bodo saltans]|uniref:Uncharacterized protein n=1 Tax=Bodo saltans TaxID=75058 RepID=A0A0S4JCV5_BODSA|nr:Hypothetical protein, putative [Bodo saltans]|eukprot:CUG87860.1 Hypothetical protein, putative [Bodo saltans]
MEQLVPSDKFRHHPEAWNQREDITKLLQKDPRLGYGRRVVPVALVQHRIESLMDVYRRNTDGALEKLQNRLKDAKQDRAVHRGPNALQTATIDAMDRATEEYLSTHRNAKEVPYAVLKQARDIVQSTTGDAHVKGRTSPEGWKHRNEQRLQQQRARLLVVEEQRKEDLQKTARRHEELVEAAAEQRRIEAAEQLCAVWETRAMLFLSHKVFAKALLQFRTHQHLVSSYSCLREHWTLWHEPAEDRATVLRRLRLKGKLRFALCAARLLGFHLVRKKHIKSITTMLSLRLSSQRFIYAVRHYICSVRLAQRRIRRYLAWKRARIVVLLLQWDAVERDMRNPNFSPLLGRSVVMDSSEHSGKGAVPELPPSGQPTAHTKDVKATGGKKSAKGSKDAVKEVVKSEDAMVNELVSRDKYDAPIPFDVRVAVVKRLWAEHRKRFYSVEQAILQRVDQEEYYKAMKAYQQLTQRKQAAVLSPKAPRPRVLPILLRRQTLIHAIQPFLDITRALLVKAKTVAARSAVRDNLHFEYFNRREAFTSLLHVNDDRMVAAFELKTHTRMPRLHLRDEAMVAMDDRNDAAGAIVSSPRTFSSSMTGGDASLRSKSFSHGSPVASTTPKGGDLVEIVSTKAVEVLQRRFPSEKAFAILGKHIEAMCRPMEQAVRDMEAPAPPPQAAAGKGTNTAGKQSPRGTARSQMPPTSAVNATHK